ncbi:MAG TPA: glycosyltransferase family 39 protein [Candidatus Brocadiia bacterium]|nr:glycosyltransferase family 39 protein [Candidatus Brocadiia bacterium]
MKRAAMPALLTAAWLAAALPSITWPLGSEQGIFAYAAMAGERGRALYAEVFDYRAPGTHVVYGFVIGRISGTEWTLRMTDLAFQLLACLAAFGIWRSTGSGKGGIASAILIAVLYFRGGWSQTAGPDAFALPFCLASIHYWAKFLIGRSKGDAGNSGAFLGFAGLFRPILLFMALPMAFGLATLPPEDKRRKGWAITAWAFGVACPVALFAAPLLWSDMRRFLFECLLSFNLRSHFWAHGADFFGGFVHEHILMPHPEFAALAALAVVTLPGLRRTPGGGDDDSTDRSLIAVFWCMAIIGVLNIMMQKSYGWRHLLMLLVPLAMLAGRGFDMVIRSVSRNQNASPGVWPARILAYGALGLALLAPTARCANQSLRAYQYLRGRIDADTYLRDMKSPDANYALLQDLAAGIDANIPLDAKICVWGDMPIINFMTWRLCPGRHVSAYPAASCADGELLARYRGEYLSEIMADPPALFIVSTIDPTGLFGGDPTRSFIEFAGLRAFLARNYAEIESVGPFRILMRK